MAFTLKDLDPEARAFLAYALLGRKERGAASAEKLRRKPRTPRLPVAEEKILEALLVRITRKINATISAALRGDLDRAKARASRADADLDGLFREALFQDLAIRLSRIVEDPEIVELLDQYGARLNATNGREIERVIGINPVDIDPEITEALLQFRRASVGLITSIAEDQLSQVRDLVDVAANSGMRVETLAAQIQERHNVSESRARLIARDQTLKTNGDLTRLRHEKIGVTEYIWDTSGDSRVRPDHRALDGSTQRWDDPPVTNPEGDRNHPGEDYQCRCIAIPVLPE